MKDIWTASRLKAYQTCPMKEALRYRENLVPISTKSALRFGTAIHRGLEMWDVDEGLNALGESFPTTQEEADEFEVTRVTAKALLSGYMKLYGPFEDHKPEFEFQIRMKTPRGGFSNRLMLAGKIDDIVHENGREWLVEYKTASKLDASYFDRLYVDSQITMYMLAAKRLGYRPAGVIYRVLRKPQIRKGIRESTEQFLNRLEVDVEARPDFYFTERRLYRTDVDLDDFERMVYQEATLSNKMYRQGTCYKHSVSCSVYGGCEYLPLCMGEAGAEALYTTREPHEELYGKDESNGTVA